MFKIGDIVRSKKTGSFYTVKKSVNDYWFIHNDSEHPKLCSNFILVSENWSKEQKGCTHQWVNVGFHFEREVCSICDVEKGFHGRH